MAAEAGKANQACVMTSLCVHVPANIKYAWGAQPDIKTSFDGPPPYLGVAPPTFIALATTSSPLPPPRYLCAVCAVLVGPEGRVLGVDHIQELVERSLEAVARVPQCRPMLVSGALRIVQGDGREGHAESAAPRGWDAIHVGAAAPQIPQALVDQLAPGGRLVCPVGPEGGTQDLVVVDRLGDGRIRKEVPMRVQFVPLTSAEHQLGRFNRL